VCRRRKAAKNGVIGVSGLKRATAMAARAAAGRGAVGVG
jgi:hypothetical protein